MAGRQRTHTETWNCTYPKTKLRLSRARLSIADAVTNQTRPTWHLAHTFPAYSGSHIVRHPIPTHARVRYIEKVRSMEQYQQYCDTDNKHDTSIYKSRGNVKLYHTDGAKDLVDGLRNT